MEDQETVRQLKLKLAICQQTKIVQCENVADTINIFMSTSATESSEFYLLVLSAEKLAKAFAFPRLFQKISKLQNACSLHILLGRSSDYPLPSYMQELVVDVLPHPFVVEELLYRIRLIINQHLSSTKAKFADTLLQNLGEALMITDHHDRILFVNEAFVALTGYETDEVIGKKPSFMRVEQNHEESLAAIWQSIHKSGRWKGVIQNRRKNGEVYAERLSVSVIRNNQGNIQYHLSILTDISERIIREEQLRIQAFHDVLTGLPNRMLLEDRFIRDIAAAKRKEQSVAIVFIDLDRFKEINDQFGHRMGDEILLSVANKLTKVVRATDTVCRYGGDEFVCLLTELSSSDDAIFIAKMLFRALSEKINIDQHILIQKASLGISVGPEHGSTLACLIDKADEAMYKAKREGGNQCCMYEGYQNESDWR